MDFNKLFQQINDYESSLGLRFYNQPDHCLDRYCNVKPYEHNRCILSSGRYINASYLNYPNHLVRYIITQAPKRETINEFMEVLCEEQVSIIVRLGGDYLYADKQLPCETLHFNGWPDHDVPQKDQFVRFHALYQKRIQALITKSPPTVVVHCNAGVGRSGTFVAFDIAMYLRSLGRPVNIVELVKELRKYRTLLVQTPGQLEFLYQVLDNKEQQ